MCAAQNVHVHEGLRGYLYVRVRIFSGCVSLPLSSVKMDLDAQLYSQKNRGTVEHIYIDQKSDGPGRTII